MNNLVKTCFHAIRCSNRARVSSKKTLNFQQLGCQAAGESSLSLSLASASFFIAGLPFLNQPFREPKLNLHRTTAWFCPPVQCPAHAVVRWDYQAVQLT